MSRKKRNGKKNKPNAAQKAALKAHQVQIGTVTQEAEVPLKSPDPALISDTDNHTVLYSLRVDPALRDKFKACCKRDDSTGAQVLRRYMRAYIEERDPDMHAYAVSRGWVE